jgi:hypothetical protein
MRKLWSQLREPPAVVVAGVLAARAAVLTTGDRFHADHLHPPSMWHLLDPDIMRANPFVALWDVHTTPPLFNFLVGGVLAWSPERDALSLQVLFTAGGVFGALALYSVVRLAGCRAWVAIATALLVFCDPYLIGFETYLSHEAFAIPMLMAVVWSTAAYAARPSGRRLALVLASGLILVMTRAMFHPLWFAMVVATIVVVRAPPLPRLRLAAACALPFLVIGGFMVKNEVRFGTFSLSSWGGMNLARVALIPLGDEERQRMVDAGVLSKAARVQPFSPYEDYAPYVPPCRAHYGTPALDRPMKAEPSSFPNINFNYACYVPVYQQEGHDAIVAIRHHPGWYARSVVASSELFVSQQRGTPELGGLHGRAAGVLYAAYGVVHLRRHTLARYPHVYPLPADYELGFVPGLVVVVGFGLRAARRAWRRTAGATDLVALVVAETVVIISLICVLADAFENGRFRGPLNPLVYGTLYACGLEFLARLVDRRRRAAPAGETPRIDAPAL